MKKTIYFVLIYFIGLVSTGAADQGAVLIDPGHSLNSHGVMSCSETPENKYNEDLANVIVTFLAANKIPVALSRKANEEKSLADRALATSGNILILSIHHDSVQPWFIYRQTKKGGKCSKKAKGFSIFVSRKNPYYEKSLQYANALGSALVKRGVFPSLHHSEPIPGENRQLLVADKGIYLFDDLVVLKSAKTPAVLLEAAVIVNPEDETLARTDSYRTSIAESIYEMLSFSQ